MTTNDVFDRLSAANPHPDIADLYPTPSEFELFLRDLEETPVETITKPPQPDKTSVPRGLLVAAGAFALAVFVVGAAWLLNSEPVAETPTDIVPTTIPAVDATPDAKSIDTELSVSASSQTVLDELERSYNEGDIADYTNLFASGMTTVLGDMGGRPSPNGAGSGNDFSRDLARHQDRISHEMRMNTQLELSECSGDKNVVCSVRYLDFFSEALMGGDQTILNLEIVDGKIHGYRETAVNGRNFDDWLAEMSDWTEANQDVAFDWTDTSYEPDSATKWHIFARMYLDFAGRDFTPVPIAPDVPLADLAVIWHLVDRFGTGAEGSLNEVWDNATITFEASDRTFDSSGVLMWSQYLAATGSSLTIRSCEPRFSNSAVCEIAIEEDFRRSALLARLTETPTFNWTFTISDGLATEVSVFDPILENYFEGVEAFRRWAVDKGVAVEVDPATGLFVPSESNISSIEGLMAEYMMSLNG